MLYGKGAGKMPTSSAVVSDIIFLSRQIANRTAGQLPYVSRKAHKNRSPAIPSRPPQVGQDVRRPHEPQFERRI